MSRIFLSHASADNAAALAISQWLSENGWDGHFLDLSADRGLAPGERWQQALRAAADRCEVVLLLVSPAWLASRWCLAEFLLARQLGKTIVGALVAPVPLAELPGELTAEWQLCDLAHGEPRRVFAVAQPPVVAATTVALAEDGLLRLKHGLQRAGLDPETFPWPPPGEPDRSPYRGLKALDAGDAAVFFGRESAVVRGLDALRGLRERAVESLFVILGASGAGKSSFLRAGLWPRLARDERHFLVLPVMRPERAAIGGAAGLLAALEAGFSAQGTPRSRALLRRALSDPAGLAGLLAELQALAVARAGEPGIAPPLPVMAIDQGEELFGPDGADEAARLLAGLAVALDPGRGPARALAIVAIRSDSYELLQTAPDLARLAPVLFSLPPLAPSEYRAVIEGPARRQQQAGRRLQVEPALADRLIADTEGADALPLLAFTLERLHIEHGADGALRLADYDTLGGVRGSIEAAIDAAFALPGNPPAVPADRTERDRLLRAAFVPWLARVDPDTEERKRRVARLDELPPPALPLIDRLVAQRLLVRDRRRLDDGSDAVVIEVAHEALLRRWPALVGWLDEEAAALKQLDALQRAARDWLRHRDAAGGGDAWLLHAGERLAAALALQAQPQYARLLGAEGGAYLAACHEREATQRREREARIEAERLARERELAQARALAEEQARRADEQAAARRRQRRFSAGLGVLLLVALAAFGLAWQQRNQAEDRGRLALSRQIAAVATSMGEADIEEKLLVAVAAQRAGATDEARAALQRAMAQVPQLEAVLPRQAGKVWSVAVSPDGRTLVSGQTDGTMQWWDLAAVRPLGPPRRLGQGVIWALAFSPDGRRLASIGEDKTVRLWDAARREPVGAPLPAEGRNVVFSPDGRTLAFGGADGSLVLWDLEAAQPRGDPLRGGSNGLAFSPDGRTVAADGGLGQITLWDVASGSGTALGELPREDRDQVNALAFSPDGRWLVSAAGARLAVWSVERRRSVTAPLDAHEGTVWGLAFRPDGEVLASVGQDRQIRLWRMTFGSLASAGPPMAAHRDRINGIVFTPDGRQLVSAGEDRVLMLWHAEPRPALAERLEGAPGGVAALAFAPDGRTLAAAGATVVRWDLAARRPVGPPLDGVGQAIAYSPDGRWLAVAAEPRSTIWDLSGPQPAARAIPLPAVGLAFAPDSRRLALGGRGRVTLWDPLRQAPDGEALPGPAHARALAFSPDGARLAVGGGSADTSPDATIALWALPARRPERAPIETHWFGIWTLAFAPDGRTIAAAGDRVALFDPQAGARIGEPLREDSAHALAYGKSGRLIAFEAEAQIGVVVWDAARRRALGLPLSTSLSGKYRRDQSVAISPDDRWLAAIGDGDVLLFPLDADAWAARACRIAGRNLTQAEWARWIGADVPYAPGCPELPAPAPAAVSR